jgi:hypothetical protein
MEEVTPSLPGPTPLPGPVFVPKIDSTIAHAARTWNYLLGGKDNFEADRQAGDQMVAAAPQLAIVPKVARAFLVRVVNYLVKEGDIRQLLDIGAGLPTMDNVHEVAQAVAPESRVVYVDNDPIVLVHARALLSSSPVGATAYVDGDVHDPAAILAQAARTLDFGKPLGYVLQGVLQFVIDYQRSLGVVKYLLDACPSGSYLAIGVPASDREADAWEAVRTWNRTGAAPITVRSHAEVLGYFDGLELVEPGVVMMNDWRPDDQTPRDSVSMWAGVARKP